MTALDTYLRSDPRRCSTCGFHPEAQGCECNGTLKFALALKSAGQSLATAAHPTEAAAVDAAIRHLAATGGEWSANELRDLVPDARGPIMGARFSAAAKSGLIRDTGRRVPSTLASTHAHEVRVWRGVAA